MSDAVLEAAKFARTRPLFGSPSPSPSPRKSESDVDSENGAPARTVYMLLDPRNTLPPIDDGLTSPIIPAATTETPPLTPEAVHSPEADGEVRTPTHSPDKQPPKPEPTHSDDADRADATHIEKPKESGDEGMTATSTAETPPTNAASTTSSAASNIPAVDKPAGKPAPAVKRQRQTTLAASKKQALDALQTSVPPTVALDPE